MGGEPLWTVSCGPCNITLTKFITCCGSSSLPKHVLAMIIPLILVIEGELPTIESKEKILEGSCLKAEGLSKSRRHLDLRMC